MSAHDPARPARLCMDAVLPLTARDLERAELLFESLSEHFSGLGTLWVVCPERDRRTLESALASGPLGGSIRVESETEVVPELAFAPFLKGWYRQQLIKLAIHERVQSDFYLTLDADVVCTRPLGPELLTPDGRGVCHIVDADLHPDWYAGSAATLGLPLTRRVSHNVTPAVLSRHAVGELSRYLDGRVNEQRFSSGLRGISQRLLLARARASEERLQSYRLLLAASAPWTEYALYYTFLEAMGRYDAFHVTTPYCLYDLSHSVWRDQARAFEKLDLSAAFAGAGPPWFLVVQSNTRIPPSEVRKKLGNFVHHV